MSVTVKKFDTNANSYSDLEVNKDVFGQEPNKHVIYLSVVRQLANARTATACTLTKSEVRGGGRKPWKQKGTGRARSGSIRSPLWKGGGVIFGPKPKSYEKDMPKKVKKLAIRSALSSELNKLIIISGGLVSSHKTSEFVTMLEKLNLNKEDLKKVLLVVGDNSNVRMSARNLPNVKTVYPEHVGAYDLLNAKVILVTEDSLAVLEGRAKNA